MMISPFWIDAFAELGGSHKLVLAGDQESFGFVVRAIGYGGVDFDDDTPETLAEAMAVLEAGLARWFEEEGVGLE